MTNTENRRRKYDIKVMGDSTKENQSKKIEEIIKTIIPVHFPERKDRKLHTERSLCIRRTLTRTVYQNHRLMKKSFGS